MTAEDQIAMNQTHNAYGFRARFYSHAIRLEEEKNSSANCSEALLLVQEAAADYEVLGEERE